MIRFVKWREINAERTGPASCNTDPLFQNWLNIRMYCKITIKPNIRSFVCHVRVRLKLACVKLTHESMTGTPKVLWRKSKTTLSFWVWAWNEQHPSRRVISFCRTGNAGKILFVPFVGQYLNRSNLWSETVNENPNQIFPLHCFELFPNCPSQGLPSGSAALLEEKHLHTPSSNGPITVHYNSTFPSPGSFEPCCCCWRLSNPSESLS